MIPVLDRVHGTLLVTRPPVPATLNKAGANYKSEVAHRRYLPRAAFEEWLNICDGIVAFGGDAIFEFESADTPYLGVGNLEVDGAGDIRPAGSSEVIGNVDSVETGRVFTANGPWVVARDDKLVAVLPNMLEHRRSELSYYRNLLQTIAEQCRSELEIHDNPHPWEGMADVAALGDKVILTYAVPGHYDQGVAPKSRRSSREGVLFAARTLCVPEDAIVTVELVYPHFHGDTVHFSVRPPDAPPVLAHYPGGLWGDGASTVRDALGEARIIEIGRDDAVEAYAGNSRQVDGGVLIPAGASSAFEKRLGALGLQCRRVRLSELFGKAGGGPGCATLYLPSDIALPENSTLRYSQKREAIAARREQLPESLEVAPEFFEGRRRG